jgi:Co/Zn/Cd efflux system component
MFGWNLLDPIMGIVGALVITRWSYSLLKETSPILLDENIEEHKKLLIKEKIESDSDNRICDLHLWKVGPSDYAVVVSLVTHYPKPVEHYKNLLRDIHNLPHITIEVNQCTSEPCIVPEIP